MEPQHSVGGPGLGERDLGWGLEVRRRPLPGPMHGLPCSCRGPMLSSNLHCDLTVPLERFVQEAANIQDGDSGDSISRAAHMQFLSGKKKKNDNIQKTKQIPCSWLVTIPITVLSVRLRPSHLQEGSSPVSTCVFVESPQDTGVLFSFLGSLVQALCSSWLLEGRISLERTASGVCNGKFEPNNHHGALNLCQETCSR